MRRRQWFASTEGCRVGQEIVESGGCIRALAVGEGEAQQRSYPNSFGRNQATRGLRVRA
jgi:hypothetical protein